ncbi:hypothetical protein [Actinoplanes sp. NPDC049681]|uniref:hypothetical protein n=1 Tax=Actinoplanes sp. NPDC049681 TaxID=3363905 RepID=UPI0037A6FB08
MPADAATNRATDEEKVKAAGAIGVNPGMDMLVLDDQAFVLALWRQAKKDSFVQAEALRAYDTDDADAAYEFITSGVFTAAGDDARAEIAEAQAQALRRSVAVIVKLDPSDTKLIEQSDRDFIFSVFQKVPQGKHVWTAAKAAIADGTDQDDWSAFLHTAAAAAAEQDLQDAIREATEADAAKLRAEQLAQAKRSLLQLLLLPVGEELVNAPNRQFVLHVHDNAKGTEVKLASQVALNAPDADLDQALKDFIFVGGAAANTRDEAAAAAKELAGYRAKITAIRDAARREGYQPNLVAAAEKALAANTLLASQTFLLKGQEEARALDKVARERQSRPASFVSGNQQHVFARGADGKLHHWKWVPGQGRGYENWGGDLAGNPVAFVFGAQQHVLGRGKDGKLNHWVWESGKAVRRETWAGTVSGDPTGYATDDAQHVYARGTDGKLHHWSWTRGTGFAHDIIGEGIAGDPTSYVIGTQHHIWARGTDGKLTHWVWQPGKDTRRETWDGAVTGDPVGFLYGDQQHIFSRGAEGQVHDLQHWTWTTGTGRGHENWGGSLDGDPTGYATSDGQHVYARGTDGKLHHWSWVRGTGRSHNVIGDGITGNPTSYVIGTQHHIWARGTDGKLTHWVWEPGKDTRREIWDGATM